jgi:pimeloyl-ACP methyl ester carboxylesterase
VRWSVEHGMAVRRCGSGPALVWIHGLGESSVSFEAIVRHAALARFEHVLVDLPGYGRSAWPEPEPGVPSAAYGLDAVADRLTAWLSAMSPAPVVAIGHSMGGVLAQLVAERGAVRAIVDVDGNLTRGDCTFSAQACADPDPVRALAAVRDSVWSRGQAEPALRGYHAALCFAAPHVFHRQALDLVALSERGDLAARLVALHVPALYIAGVPDGICSASRAVLASLGARWLGIEPSGHWVYLDQPDAFARAVLELVDSVR